MLVFWHGIIAEEYRFSVHQAVVAVEDADLNGIEVLVDFR